MKKHLTLISGSANKALAEKVSLSLGVELTPIECKRFNDGETYVRIESSVRGSQVFVIQPTSAPAHDTLMELLLIVDALKRASAQEITAIVPYFGYCRQDRKATSREPISAKLVADLLETAGVARVMTFDLHTDQIQGFFNIPVDNLLALPILARSVLERKIPNLVVVAPDAGSTSRARRLAASLYADLAIIDKRRPAHGESKVMYLMGEVKGKNALLVDDIIDTAGTIVGAATELKKRGAKDIYICATHPVFSKDAIKKLSSKDIKEIFVTDSIEFPEEKKIPKIKVVSLAPYIAELINSIYSGESMGVIVKGKFDQVLQWNKKR